MVAVGRSDSLASRRPSGAAGGATGEGPVIHPPSAPCGGWAAGAACRYVDTMRRRAQVRAEDGFTIVESLVAIVILVVGLFGVMQLLVAAHNQTTASRAREGGVNLERELVEAARNVPFTQLSQSTIVPTIQGMPGFTGSSINAAGWQVTRRGITYTMSIGVCSVDDPSDGTGAADSQTCADGTGGTTGTQCRSFLGSTGSISGTGQASGTQVGDCGIDLNHDGVVDNLTDGQLGTCTAALCGSGPDQNPEDYLRIVTLVRWDRGGGTRYALQSSTVPYPGLSGAPRITTLNTTATLPVTDPTVTSLPFTATTNRKAAAVSWLVGGTPTGTATDQTGAGTSWAFTWNLGNVTPAGTNTSPGPGEVVDNTYEVGARAFDEFNVGGQERDLTVKVNRRAPFSPPAFQVENINGQIQAVWGRNPEGDIDGYQLFRQPTSGGTGSAVCSYGVNFSCNDPSPPGSGQWNYTVYAYDNGGTRQGDPATGQVINLSDTPPTPPTSLNANRSSGQVTLTWGAASDPDPGDSVVGYRIYRDGTTLLAQYATVAGGTLTFTDTKASDGSHTYYVAAIDSAGTESAKTAGATA